MQKINQIFNDIYFSTRILANATRLRDTLEHNRDNELELIGNEEEKKLISEQYRKKLQSIYRIRNNAYSYLLKKGFHCTYKTDKEDNSKIFYMNIEGTIYDCKESAVKNILGKEYEEIVKYCLSEEEFSKIALENIIKEEQKENEIINVKKEIKQKTIQTETDQISMQVEIKKETKPESIQTNSTEEIKENINKKIFTESDFDDLLNSFTDFEQMMDIVPENTVKKEFDVKAPINSIPVLEETPEQIQLNIEKQIEPEIIEANPIVELEEKQEKVLRCPRCFAPIEENEKICGFCGYNIDKQIKMSKEEFDSMDDTDDFSEEDIDKMFEELEKRLNNTNSETINTISIDQSKNNTIEKETETEENVRLYNPEKSEPSKKRSEMIMDIYTLKLKDPKPETDESQEPEVQKRMKKSALLEANNIIEEKDDDSVIREIKIYIYPLSVPESGTELSSEILIYITQDNACGAFCSPIDGVNTVKVNTNIHNFIVRGQWDNGNFITKVISNGKTLLDNCEIERKKETIRPEDISSAKLGHPITFLSIEYIDGTETMKIHSVPLSNQNEEDGNARTLYLMENINKKERKIFMTKNNINQVTFEFEDEIYKATSKWSNDKFKTKIENY